MKAIITAAGEGTRSGLNGNIRKELLSIYDYRNGTILLRPIIDVLILRFLEADINEIAAVLDPGDIITKNYLKNTYPSVKLFFQKERKGFGDAVLSARDFIDDGGFVVAAGDGLILDFNIIKQVLFDSEKEKRWTLFVMKVDNPKKYGVALLDLQKSPFDVLDVLEKPQEPPSNFALCALYYFPPEIFQFIRNRQGNAELTDAIGDAIRSGIKFSAVEIPKDLWISVGTADDYRLVINETYKFATRTI